MNKIKKLFEQVDLTKGTIWKVIIWFSIPILISYLFQQIYSIADASICGKYLNVNQVAGVNNTSNIVFIVLQFAFGCTAGFSVVTSNKVGQKDEEGVKKSFAIQIKLSLYISVLLTIIACLMAKPMLSMIGLTESSNLVQNEIFSSAYTYVMIIFIGTTAQMFYNLICLLRPLHTDDNSLLRTVQKFLPPHSQVLLSIWKCLVKHPVAEPL